MKPYLWAALLSVLCVSCSTWREPPAVSVALVNARFHQATLWETTMEAEVRVQNESPEPLVIDGAVHKIYLDGTLIGSGLSGQPIEVPRLDSAVQTMTLHLRNLALAVRFHSLLHGGPATYRYRIQSRLYVARGNGTRTVRAEREGTIDLSQFQPQPLSNR